MVKGDNRDGAYTNLVVGERGNGGAYLDAF